MDKSYVNHKPSPSHHIFIGGIPSGKHTKSYGKSPCYEWETWKPHELNDHFQ